MSVLVIDMASFKAVGTRNAFQLKDREEAILKGKMDREALSFELEGQVCNLDVTEANYGGKRYWFLCPACDRRKRVLLYRDGYYACRQCLDIPYPSLNRTKTDPQYYWDQAYKIAKALDPSFEWLREMQGIGYFPKRPPNMSHRKYWEKYLKFEKYVDKGNSYWISGATKGW